MKLSRLTVAMAATIGMCMTPMARLAAQNASQNKVAASANGAVPRMPDGHPDLSGVWWFGADVGGKTADGKRAGPNTAGPSYTSLYNDQAKALAKTLADKDDPTLACRPTAFGTWDVDMFDVGGVAQIAQTSKFVILLTETFHGFQLIPFDGRPHRADVPPSYRGDAVGRWDGDTFVVDKTNFTGDTWMSAEGRVSFHSDQLHIVERYTRKDAKTLEIEATVTDPKVLTKPWEVPKQTLVLAPFDMILSLNCAPSDTSTVDAAVLK